MLVTVAIALLVAGVALAAYAFVRSRNAEAESPAVPVVAAEPALSESQRVDAVFAAGTLESETARAYLIAALDDPSEAVALAAASTFAGSGALPAVESWLRSHPGERSARLADAIATLGHGDIGP